MEFIKSIVKKLRRADEPAAVDDEELLLDEIEEVEEEGKEDEDFKVKVMERLGNLDDDVGRMKISISNIRKEITEVKNELGRLDESLKDIMMLYEVVSTQINPFIGESQVTAASIERLERLTEEVKEMKNIIDDIIVDLKLLTMKEVDIRSIIMEVLQEG
ncbi:MAG: flagellar protein FlaC [Euryarchaeota archaeon]|nr:flagellar protein FlaC [Euryarchaeota archaeon]